MFKYLLQAIAFSSTVSAVPACVIACAAEAAGYGSDCQNLVDFQCIISKQSSTLDSCLSKRCSDVDAAKQAVASIATEFNVSDDLSSASVSASASASASSSSTVKSSSVESTTSVAESSITSSKVATNETTTIAPTTTVAITSCPSGNTTTIAPIETSATTTIPVVNEGCISGNGVAAVAAVAMAAAALL